jgi:hypothetical protein
MTLNRAMKIEMERSVARGVRYLDKHEPQWFTHVSLDTLDLQATGLCILGQCFGNFWTALKATALKTPGGKVRDNHWAIRNGFNAPYADSEREVPNGAYEYLTFAWVPHIAVRQQRERRRIAAEARGR